MKSTGIVCAIAAALMSFASLSFAQGYDRPDRDGRPTHAQPQHPVNQGWAGDRHYPIRVALARSTTNKMNATLTGSIKAMTGNTAHAGRSFIVVDAFRRNTATASTW